MARQHIFSITKKHLKIQTFRAGGKGGQHQNKTDSAVRIIHSASGAVGESRSERSQYQNKRIALKRLVDTGKFKSWVSRAMMEITSGKTIEQRVDEQMQNRNLKIETKDENGRWAPKEH